MQSMQLGFRSKLDKYINVGAAFNIKISKLSGSGCRFFALAADDRGQAAGERFCCLDSTAAFGDGSVKGAFYAAQADFKLDLSRCSAKNIVLGFYTEGPKRETESFRLEIYQNGPTLLQAEFAGAEGFKEEKAAVLLSLYFKDGWRLARIGQGFADGIEGLCRHYKCPPALSALFRGAAAPAKPQPASALQNAPSQPFTADRGFRSKLAEKLDEALPFEVKLCMTGTAVYDFSCFGVDKSNKLSDDRYMVFYNQLASPNREVALTLGEKEARFAVSLAKLPGSIEKLVFTVSIDGAGSMNNIVAHDITVSQNGRDIFVSRYVGGMFQAEKAIISLEIYKKEVWRISFVGQGFDGGLSELLKHYGGEEIQAAPAAPSAKPVSASVSSAPVPKPAPLPAAPPPAKKPKPAPAMPAAAPPPSKAPKPASAVPAAAPPPAKPPKPAKAPAPYRQSMPPAPSASYAQSAPPASSYPYAQSPVPAPSASYGQSAPPASSYPYAQSPAPSAYGQSAPPASSYPYAQSPVPAPSPYGQSMPPASSYPYAQSPVPAPSPYGQSMPSASSYPYAQSPVPASAAYGQSMPPAAAYPYGQSPPPAPSPSYDPSVISVYPPASAPAAAGSKPKKSYSDFCRESEKDEPSGKGFNTLFGLIGSDADKKQDSSGMSSAATAPPAAYPAAPSAGASGAAAASPAAYSAAPSVGGQAGVQVRICPVCGAKSISGSRFCEDCGTPLPEAGSASPQPSVGLSQAAPPAAAPQAAPPAAAPVPVPAVSAASASAPSAAAAGGRVICPSCGNSVCADKYCEECGAELKSAPAPGAPPQAAPAPVQPAAAAAPAASVNRIICPVCGSSVRPDKYCEECGSELASAAAPAAGIPGAAAAQPPGGNRVNMEGGLSVAARGSRANLSQYLNPAKPFSVEFNIAGGECDFACLVLNAQNKILNGQYCVGAANAVSQNKEIDSRIFPEFGFFNVNLTALPEAAARVSFVTGIKNAAASSLEKHSLIMSQDGTPKVVSEFSGRELGSARSVLSVELERKGGSWEVYFACSGYSDEFNSFLNCWR